METVRDHIQAASLHQETLRIKDDELTLDEYVHNLGARPKKIQTVNLWTRVMHGVESTELSAAWLIDYCQRNGGLLAIRVDNHTGGNYVRITMGMSSMHAFFMLCSLVS